MARHGRVVLVIRPVDHVLTVFRVALLPAIVAVVSLPTLNALNSSAMVPGPVQRLLGVAGFLAVAACVVLLQAPTVGRHVDRIVAATRRRVAMSCNQAEGHRDSRIACHLTPPMLRAPLFRYDEQRQVVAALVEACRAGPSGQYFFIEGDSGSGKTRTALLLVHALVRSPDLFELASRTFLYDLASPGAHRELLRRLGSSRHEQAVVIVDNFHRATAATLRDLTSRLVDRPQSSGERLILFLARPASASTLGPGSDVRLMSEAKAGDRHFELNGPPADSVAHSVFEIDPDASRLVRDLEPNGVASAAQLHLAQVIARNGAAPPEIEATLRLLNGTDGPVPPLLVPLLGTVAGLAMHRGTFTKREFKRAARVVAANLSERSEWLARLRLRSALRRLDKVGFVPRFQLGTMRYVFHEALAELCIDRLAACPSFYVAFTAVGRQRLETLSTTGEDLARWLVAVEIGDEETTTSTFDGALFAGAYSQMARCLRRATARYVPGPAVRLQLAILLDRVGDFTASRLELTDDVAEALAATDLGVVFLTSRLEVNHDEESAIAVRALTKNPDLLVRCVGEYWAKHIAAHRGAFDSDGLLALAEVTLDAMGDRRSHWATYSLARMFGDSLRHHYLAGVTSAPRAILGGAVADYLRARLPTFEANHILYSGANYVSYVLLPQRAIFNQPVTAEQAAVMDVDRRDVASIDAMVRTAQNLYRRARDEFWQYGDRGARYLEADVLNAEIIEQGADLDELTLRLHEYKRFIRTTGFPDIAAYPHLYFFRWHVLKYYAVVVDASVGDARTADEHRSEAGRHLREVQLRDEATANEYGLLRAELLGELLDTIGRPPREDVLGDIGRRADERGYGFESRLARHLSARPSITAAELRTVLRFYPFVHQ